VVLQDLEDFTAENAEIAEKKIVFVETRAFTPTNSFLAIGPSLRSGLQKNRMSRRR